MVLGAYEREVRRQDQRPAPQSPTLRLDPLTSWSHTYRNQRPQFLIPSNKEVVISKRGLRGGARNDVSEVLNNLWNFIGLTFFNRWFTIPSIWLGCRFFCVSLSAHRPSLRAWPHRRQPKPLFTICVVWNPHFYWVSHYTKPTDLWKTDDWQNNGLRNYMTFTHGCLLCGPKCVAFACGIVQLKDWVIYVKWRI